MTVKKLAELAEIQIGLLWTRKKGENEGKNRPEFACKRLTLQSLKADGSIDPLYIVDYFAEKPPNSRFLTRTGDIVMKLFAPLNPVVITDEYANFLAPSQLVIITPEKGLLPEYLRYYLAQSDLVRNELLRVSGAARRTLTVRDLKEFGVRVPSLSEQKKFIHLEELHNRKMKLLSEKIDLETQRLLAVFNSLGGK